MFHPLSLYIGLRYTRAKRKNNFISFISLVSIGGIALGITTMIVVLSVMNGFQHEVRERSLAMTAHIAITRTEDQGITNWQALANIAQQNSEVLGAAPFTNGQALLSNAGIVQPVQINGIDPKFEANVSDIGKKLNPAEDSDMPDAFKAGNLDQLKAGEFNIILGINLAKSLNATIGDKVSLISSEINVSAMGASPRVKRFNVIAIFESGFSEFDANIALIHINDASKIFKIPDDKVQGVRLKVKDISSTYTIAVDIYNRIKNSEAFKDQYYEVYDWTRNFEALFRMIQIEKVSMMVIMSLIVAVAVFNVVSTLIMVVTDKRADIAILRTMGLSPKQIMIIFMTQGIVIGFFGAIIGIILGLLIAYNVSEIVRAIQEFFNTQLFDASLYPVSDIPSLVLTNDVVFVAGFAFLLASLATLYPAWKAARTQPAEALRYE